MKLRTISALSAVLTALLCCSGCNSCRPIPSLQVLTFTMKWPSIPQSQWTQVRQDLENGTRTLADVQFGGVTCEFVNDAAAARTPTVSLSGNPGDPGLNFSYSSIGLIRAQNLGTCAPGVNAIPTEILINTDQGLVVGQVHKGGNMVVTIGNDKFTADYREFTLQNADVARRSATVRFQMMATNHANSQDTRVLMVVDGSIATPY